MIVLLLFLAATPAMAGSIAGSVYDAASGRPVADAIVYLNRGSAGAAMAEAVEGRYVFRDIPAGRHRVTAHGPSELAPGTGAYASRWVVLADGQDLKDVDFRLAAHGEISGAVRDEEGEPLPGITVLLVAREYWLGALRHVIAGVAETDDRGVYALKRVDPGRAYVLHAQERVRTLDAVSDAPADPERRRPALAPVYHPGTPEAAGALPFVLRPGERRENVDFRMPRLPAFCLDGALEPGGLAFWLEPREPASGRSGDGAVYMRPPGGKTGADGKLRLCGLVPGEYRLSAFDPGDETRAYGVAEIAITDRDSHDIRLTAQPRIAVAGQVVWEGSPQEIVVAAEPVTRSTFRGEETRVRAPAPGEFNFGTLFTGDCLVQILRLPPDAYVKEATYAGRDVLLEPLHPGSGLGDARLRIVLGDDGSVANIKTEPEAAIVLMPADAVQAPVLAARMVLGQTDQEGRWRSPRLAPGKYLALALRTPPDRGPESLAALLSRRTKAHELELGPIAAVQVTLEPVD